jgi:hypothetical protein
MPPLAESMVRGYPVPGFLRYWWKNIRNFGICERPEDEEVWIVLQWLYWKDAIYDAPEGFATWMETH